MEKKGSSRTSIFVPKMSTPAPEPRKGRRLSVLFGVRWKTSTTDKDKTSSDVQERVSADEIKPLSKRVAISSENVRGEPRRLSLNVFSRRSKSGEVKNPLEVSTSGLSQISEEKSPQAPSHLRLTIGKFARNSPISRRTKGGPMSTTTFGANSPNHSAPIEISSGYCHGYLRVIPATSNNSIQDNINQTHSRRYWFVFDDYTLRIFKDRTTSEEISQPIRLERCTVVLVDDDDLSLVILMETTIADAIVFDPYFANADSPQTNSPPSPSIESDEYVTSLTGSETNEDQNSSSRDDANSSEEAPAPPHLFQVPNMTVQYGGMCKLVLQAESKEERDAWFFILDRAQTAVSHTTSNMETGSNFAELHQSGVLSKGEVSPTRAKSVLPRAPRMLGDIKDSAVDREINRLSSVIEKRSAEHLPVTKKTEPMSERSKQLRRAMLDAAKHRRSILIREDSRKRLQQEMLAAGDSIDEDAESVSNSSSASFNHNEQLSQPASPLFQHSNVTKPIVMRPRATSSESYVDHGLPQLSPMKNSSSSDVVSVASVGSGGSRDKNRSKHMVRVASKELLLRYRIQEDGSIDRYTVIGGTLKTLVEHLADENTPDNIYIDTFLLTFRHIAKPAEIMDLLTTRYNIVPPIKATAADLAYYANWAQVIQIRTVAVVKKWLEQYWSFDFENSEEARDKLRIFLDVVRDSSDEMITLVSRLEQLVIDKHNAAVTDLELFNADNLKSEAQKKRDTVRPRLEFYILDPIEFAHQLTLVDYDKFAAIQPVEFLMRLWEGNTYRTRHLSSIVEWFNKVSFFTATEICVQPELKKRARLVENFIRVAEECCHHHNFNATMAVISGLNNSAVRRLKRTWALVQPRYLDILRDLEYLMSDDNNFHRYREAVNDVLSAAHPTPCIPFFGLLLRDLTFLNDGNPKTIKPTVFNFSKLRRIAHPILTQIIPFQRVKYRFPTTRLSVAVQNYLALPNSMTDQNVTYSCSLLCEPRYSNEPPPLDGHAPVRLIEKWAAENSHLRTEQDELAEVEKWTQNIANFKRSTSVLAEMASY